MTPEELDAARLELDQRRVVLEERKTELEDTRAKRWTPLILPILLPIAGTLITAIITNGVTKAQIAQQKEETTRAAIAAQHQKEIENGQAAAKMYFQNLADLRGKDELSGPEKKRFARDLEIVAAISGNDELKPVLLRVSREAADQVRVQAASTSAEGEGSVEAPSQTLQGLPDVAPVKAPATYTAADFLAYPQIPATRWDGDRQRLVDALNQLGFGTQLAQKMRPDRSPRENEVRFYRPEHRQLAVLVAQQLSAKMGQRFVVKRIGGGATLPNGVMEFWLGTGGVPPAVVRQIDPRLRVLRRIP